MSIAISPDIETEIAQFRETLASGRSDKLVRLFDYLLERTRAGQFPKETEIATDLFGDKPEFILAGNASVRVYVHRLRKKLEEFYADGRPVRISIPQGEYSVKVCDGSHEPGEGREDASEASGHARTGLQVLAALAAFVCLSGLTVWLLTSSRLLSDDPEIVGSPVWNSLHTNGNPNLIVAGDDFLFAQNNALRGTSQLVRDPLIRNGEALDVVLMRNPEHRGKLRDVDAHFLSAGTTLALAKLQAARLDSMAGGSRPTALTYGSQLTSQMLKAANIVYVGSIACLPPLLRNPLFNASGMKVGANYDELIDRESGRHFRSDGSVISEDRVATRDYGYIARLHGPSGNAIIVIMGTRDPAILQMAQLISDPSKMAMLGRDLPSADGDFEALYEVQTMGNVNVNERRLILRPVTAGDVWYRATASQRFPNDVPEADLSY